VIAVMGYTFLVAKLVKTVLEPGNTTKAELELFT